MHISVGQQGESACTSFRVLAGCLSHTAVVLQHIAIGCASITPGSVRVSGTVPYEPEPYLGRSSKDLLGSGKERTPS